MCHSCTRGLPLSVKRAIVPAGHGRVFRPLIGLMRHVGIGRAHAALAAQHVVALAGVAGGQVDQPHAAARLDVRGDVRVHEQQVVVQVRDKGQVRCHGIAPAWAGGLRGKRDQAGQRAQQRAGGAYRPGHRCGHISPCVTGGASPKRVGSADAGLGSKWGIVVRPDDGPVREAPAQRSWRQSRARIATEAGLQVLARVASRAAPGVHPSARMGPCLPWKTPSPQLAWNILESDNFLIRELLRRTVQDGRLPRACVPHRAQAPTHVREPCRTGVCAPSINNGRHANPGTARHARGRPQRISTYL